MTQYQHLTVLGDSITDQRNHYAHKWYYQWLAEWLTIPTITNLGISGSTIAQPYDPMVERWQAIPESTDLLLIYAGVNDFGRDVPLGQFGDQSTAKITWADYETLPTSDGLFYLARSHWD